MPHPVMGAEDFSYVLQQVPGTMMFLGGTHEGRNPATAPANHSNRVVFDEQAMADGVAIYAGGGDASPAGGRARAAVSRSDPGTVGTCRLTVPAVGYAAAMSDVARVLDPTESAASPSTSPPAAARGSTRRGGWGRRASSTTSRRPACAVGAAAGFPTGQQVADRRRPTGRRGSPPPWSSTPPRASRARSRTASILRRNPYRVLEGALIAASAVGADRVVVALKATFGTGAGRVRGAVDRDRPTAGWSDGVDHRRVRRPERVPVRRGDRAARGARGRTVPPRRPAVPARRRRARRRRRRPTTTRADDASRRPPWSTTSRPWPTCPASWPRARTGSGRSARPSRPAPSCAPSPAPCRRARRRRVPDGHARCARSSTSSAAAPGRGAADAWRRVSGVANALLPATGVRHAADLRGDGGRRAPASAPAGFIVFDDADDLVAVAAGVSRFLAVESCGQCTPCKQDGLEIAEILRAPAGTTSPTPTTPIACGPASAPSPTAPAATSPPSTSGS